MIYTLIKDKRSYDLPKKTLAVVERMDEVVAVDQNPALSTQQKYQTIVDFIAEMVGAEKLPQLLGSDSLDQMDLSDVVITFRKIVDAYNKPMADYERAQSLERFNQLPMDKLTQVAGILDSIQQSHD